MPFPDGAVVLQVLPSLRSGGVERGTIEMVAAIAGAGGRALVASAGGPMVPRVEAAGGEHVMLPLASKNPWRMWRNAAALERLIRARGVGLVHARSRAPAWSARAAARRSGAHFVTTYHAPYDERTPGKRAYNAVMASGERVIAISAFVADLARRRHGVPANRLRVIPRGVDPEAFDPAGVPPERVERLRRGWGLPVGAPIVLLPGRISRWKGHDVMIEAMRFVRTAGALAVFVGPLDGRDRYVAGLRQRAAELAIFERVHFVGPCDDMPAAMALADVVVSASTAPEGFGRTVIEAQAMARPVIATNHGGAAETVQHGTNGWLIAPGDLVALAAAVDRVLALPDAQRRHVGEWARLSVLRHYTTAGMQQATLGVYGELLR